MKSGVAHVVASGPSLLESATKIRPDTDLVIGFNYAALLGLRFDLYFAECATSDPSMLGASEFHRWLLTDFAANRIGVIRFKNLWEGRKIDKDYLLSCYPSSIKLVKDVYVPYSQPQLESDADYSCFLASTILEWDDCFLRQCIATVFAAISVACNSGFDHVVIHGLDLGGPHFYCHSGFQWPCGAPYDAMMNMIQSSLSPAPSGRHVMNNQAHLIPPFAEILRRRGVQVFSGSEYSPLALLLPVYKA